ncbi:MAG TPA: fatty acid desaturase CarF family protein [Pyrinomonadaceae bacterium]|nr:fatty acid desaturase CarF family protein [Pyrinomonadaceae bacterium]
MSASVSEKALTIGETGTLASRTENDSESAARALALMSSDPVTDYSGLSEPSTPLHSFLEHSTLFLFPLVFGLNLYLGLARLYELELLWLVVLGIPLGLVFGDLVTGIVHWIGDTYFEEDTPIIGPGFVKPFRLHHIYPRDICTHNIVTTLGNSCIMAVPLLSFCLYLLLTGPVAAWLAFAVLFTTILAIATVATNQFHKWAHDPQPKAIARLLQRCRLVLEPSHHAKHHTTPHDSHYCITNGWLNPLLNKIKFFRRLEVFLRFWGIKPARSRDH